MGMMTAFKAGKALRLQKAGNREEALRLYEEAFAEGLNDPRYILPYALMMLRDGQYQKTKEFLVKHQKAPGMTQQQRTELLVYYSACCLRLGDVDKGISVLEQQFRKTETGLLYQTLGYLYVEKYDLEHKPDFAALRAAAGEIPESRESGNPEEGGEETAAADPEKGGEETAAADPEAEWNTGLEKAEEFLRKAVDYDDEDAICLDNMGEFLYRVRGDRAGAKEWFEKAIAIKERQIDTLYFLSRYDLEAGNREAALEKLAKASEGRFSPLNYCTPEKIRGEIEQLKGEQ